MASKPFPTKTLNNRVSIPMLAYGTGTTHLESPSPTNLDQSTIQCITSALSLGYHHIDCAEMYNTEAELGASLKTSSIPRSNLFITTKVVNDLKNIPSSLDNSLKKLGLDYVDLYLIHSPWVANSKEELQKAWKDMESMQRSGKARTIGVSNCQIAPLRTILEVAEIIPAINQVEFHPCLPREELRKFCDSKGIAVAAFSPLQPLRKGAPGPLDQVVERLAGKYGVEKEVVLLRWTMEMGVVVVTTSKKRERMEGCLKALECELTREEVEEIERVGKGKRFRGNHFTQQYRKEDFE